MIAAAASRRQAGPAPATRAIWALARWSGVAGLAGLVCLAFVLLPGRVGAAPGDPPGGWQASYFANRDLAGSPAQGRVDATIDFDWGAGAPAEGLPADNFSVRWTGDVLADVSGTYTFFVASNDGVRLRVAGQTLVDIWTNGIHDSGGSIQLQGGQWYPLSLEYFEGTGTARIRLAYAPPGAPGQVIPADHLRLGSGSGSGPVPTNTAVVAQTPVATAPPVPTSAPVPQSPPASGGGGSTSAPALLARYEIRGPLPEARNLAYRPRQFVAGLGVPNASWGTQQVDNPGPYAGWDLLATPDEGITRISDRSDWLVFQLNRPAALAVVWRWGSPPPGWLGGWQPGAAVVVNGSSLPTYTRRFGAGEVVLGGVYDPGTVPGSNDTRNTYWVLLAEDDGRPSAAPAVPAGQEVPRPNETCPAWVHDQYTATGPDGRRYATWHPQIDPVYWCYFRHDHGSNPAQLAPGYQPLYGYASTAAGANEPHAGFKSYVMDDGAGRRWLFSHHFGTGSIDRACVQFHDVGVAVAAGGEVLAELHLMGDFGKAVVNATGEALTPAACPGQAAQSDASGSRGVRQLPVVTRGAIGYEPWRLDEHRTILGLTGGLTFITTDAVVLCNDVTCDRAVVTGSTGTHRFFTYTRGFGITAGALSGTFYTDAYGRTSAGAGQPGAIRQYVKPGFSVSVPYFGDNQTCHTSDPWTAFYTCDANLSQGLPTMLENAIQPPN